MKVEGYILKITGARTPGREHELFLFFYSPILTIKLGIFMNKLRNLLQPNTSAATLVRDAKEIQS